MNSMFSATNLQHSIQHQLLNGLQTGNPILDMMMGPIIITIIGAIFSFIGSVNIRSWIPWTRLHFWYLKFCIFLKIKFLGYEEEVPEARTIQSIDQNQKTNYLYDAMQWYLPQHLRVMEGDCREVTLNDPINAAGNRWVKKVNVNNVPVRRPILNTRNQVIFENMDITFSTSTEVRKMYIDTEIQRDCYVINLSCSVPKSRIGILDRMIDDAVAEYAKHKKEMEFKQRAFMNDGSQWKEVAKDQAPRPIETVVLPGDQTQELICDLTHFLQGAEWYSERGLAYTRRYMFYGPPGCGKSSTIRAIATFAQRDIYSMNLTQLGSDKELNELFNRVPSENAVLVFEDIDCMGSVVHDREKKDAEEIAAAAAGGNMAERELKIVVCNDNQESNRRGGSKSKSENSGVTLSGLLNAIDGVVEKHGLIIVMTTNRKEILDKALVRPGRIDFKIFFQKAALDQLSGFYKLMYSKSKRELEELAEQMQIAMNENEKEAIAKKIVKGKQPISLPDRFKQEFQEGKVSPAFIVITMLRYYDTPIRALEEIVERSKSDDPDVLE